MPQLTIAELTRQPISMQKESKKFIIYLQKLQIKWKQKRRGYWRGEKRQKIESIQQKKRMLNRLNWRNQLQNKDHKIFDYIYKLIMPGIQVLNRGIKKQSAQNVPLHQKYSSISTYHTYTNLFFFHFIHFSHLHFSTPFFFFQFIFINFDICMKTDLLILRILKVPVTIIKYISQFFAILTYLPNYLLILIFDAIIFHPKAASSLFAYTLSWPFRIGALLAVISIFSLEFYGLYSVLSISHLHWGLQIFLSIVTFQGILALMRKGYLTMIDKFSPTKLKSPLQHLQQLWIAILDTMGIMLGIINILLVINSLETLDYKFDGQKKYNFLKHIKKCIHKSIVELTVLIYVTVVFRMFGWRYWNQKETVDKQVAEKNALQLLVLLNLLLFFTMLDLFFFIIFGLYCVGHPRRNLFLQRLRTSHQKYKIILKFTIHSQIQLLQCILLFISLPFRFTYAKEVLGLVLDKHNDYSFHYLDDTLYVFKLALLKPPALFCQLILFIFHYKYKKIEFLIKKGKKPEDSAAPKPPLFQSKLHQAGAGINPSSSKNLRPTQRDYIVFRCFGEVFVEIWFLFLVPICSLLKLWNISWVLYLVDRQYNLRTYLIIIYLLKNLNDILYIIPSLATSFLLGFYDPVKFIRIVQNILKQRKNKKESLPSHLDNFNIDTLSFYKVNSAVLPQIFYINFSQIKKDVFFIPLFIASRLSLLSLMNCQHPSDSVELFQSILLMFFIKRVAKSKYSMQYFEFFKRDQAAGLIKTQREKLRFWQFAYKSIRHRNLHLAISFVLPKRMSAYAIQKAQKYNSFSLISNHYWNCYRTTFALLQQLLFFVIQLIISLIGIVFLLPLTLWRMPTFLILFKSHGFKKRFFFKLLFAMYKQMFFDILSLLIRIPCFIMFPRAYIKFCLKTCFKYTKLGIQEFERVEKMKKQYLVENILAQGIILYLLLLQLIVVKILWVRKRDMNLELKNNNIKLSKYYIEFMLTPQYIPSLSEMKIKYGGFKQENEQQKGQEQIPQTQTYIEQKQKQISLQSQIILQIVQKHFSQALDDIPYLLLMLFLLCTLPWRVYYILDALFLMRNDNKKRGEFLKILRMVSKDYQCIALYLLLIFSIVKTKRAFALFYRNFKLNFYVGTLKYSHLKELRSQMLQALQFYYSLVILGFSILFGPYRALETFTNVMALYKKYRDDKEQEEKNRKMYENTLKQGKSLQLITSIGNNTLQHVFRFLTPLQLTKMTRVSRYMYDSIKQNHEIWLDQWERLYSAQYPAFTLKNDNGELSYNSMCVEKFRSENLDLFYQPKNKLRALSINEFRKSAYETSLDLKRQLAVILPSHIHRKIFTSLNWDIYIGYGPQQNWPQPDDNEEFLQIMNIQRAPLIDQHEMAAAASWLYQRPIQSIIIKLNHFYNVDNHRRKKQFLYLITTCISPFIVLYLIYVGWSDIWELTVFIGYKFIFTIYVGTFITVFAQRYNIQANIWVSLNPFDLKQDFVYICRVTRNWVVDKSIKTGEFVKDKFTRFVVKPIKWICKKIVSIFKWFGRKATYAGNLFVQKVAKPLYVTISNKIKALWKLIKFVGKTLMRGFKQVLKFVGNIFRSIYTALFSLAKSISKFYSNMLQSSLRFALSFGDIGELIFTIITIIFMVSPSIFCYFYYKERWFIIFSSLLTMVFIVTGYRHLSKMKERVLTQK